MSNEEMSQAPAVAVNVCKTDEAVEAAAEAQQEALATAANADPRKQGNAVFQAPPKPRKPTSDPEEVKKRLKELHDQLGRELEDGKIRPDPDRFIKMAKELVVNNYNEHRVVRNSSDLTMEGVYIVWFAKTLGNWKAIVSSPVIRGLLWEVSFNGHRKEAYIDVYKKLNNVKVPVEDQ